MAEHWIAVETALEQQGIRVASRLLAVEAIPRKRNAALQARIKETIAHLDCEALLASPWLAGYRKQHERFGVGGEMPAAANLLRIIRETGGLPHINPIVDAYNLISASTLLSAGAHDFDRVEGPLRVVTTRGDEYYRPLGAAEAVPVSPGEFACRDDRKIICRMDIKQCEETRVSRDTRHILVYVQGCPEISQDELESGVQQMADLMVACCGAVPWKPQVRTSC